MQGAEKQAKKMALKAIARVHVNAIREAFLLMNEKDKAKETTQTQDTTTKEKNYPCQGCKEFKVNNLWV